MTRAVTPTARTARPPRRDNGEDGDERCAGRRAAADRLPDPARSWALTSSPRTHALHGRDRRLLPGTPRRRRHTDAVVSTARSPAPWRSPARRAVGRISTSRRRHSDYRRAASTAFVARAGQPRTPHAPTIEAVCELDRCATRELTSATSRGTARLTSRLLKKRARAPRHGAHGDGRQAAARTEWSSTFTVRAGDTRPHDRPSRCRAAELRRPSPRGRSRRG